MSATALLLKEAGWSVSGSDAECYGPPKDILERAGISFSLGYKPENIPAEVECFVIGRNAKLSPTENAEVRAAIATGKPIYSFPEMLGQITEGRENVVVAGSYGKSTVTSLVAHILRHAGVDAGYFIGAEPVQTEWLRSPAALGTAQQFVLEGDEYPSAHDDARAKFLHLSPRDILLTSMVHDHINVYPTPEEYEKPFKDLTALVPGDGVVIACAEEPHALAVAEASGKKVISYGLSQGLYSAGTILYGAPTRFALLKNGETLCEIETNLLGAHNIQNIVGASAWILSRELATAQAVARAVADFKGVRRRLDNLAPSSRVPVYEGFGSSYEKARAAIEAIRLHFPARPLTIVFEPHTFGWRNRGNLSWYDSIFEGAEVVFVAAPETQGAGTHAQLSHEEIITRIGTTARPYTTPEGVAGSLTDSAVVLILTSGSLEGTLDTLVETIAETFTQ